MNLCQISNKSQIERQNALDKDHSVILGLNLFKGD